MDFGYALKALKEGCKVFRPGWNGRGMFLFLVGEGEWNLAVGGEMYDALPSYEVNEILTRLPWIGMKTADNKIVPWLASQTDLLSDDWSISVQKKGGGDTCGEKACKEAGEKETSGEEKGQEVAV